MRAAGALYAFTRTRRADLLDRLAELLSDHHNRYSIDYYNQYGDSKGAQWPERGHVSYSVTCAGAFGMLFRALLDLQVSGDSLEVSPKFPQECEHLRTKSPVLYGGKTIYFSVQNGEEAIRAVKLNGKSYGQHAQGHITLPYKILQANNLVEVELQT
jgi:cellobiose phosphorylase